MDNILISRFELAAARRDYRERRWHDYHYTDCGSLLRPFEQMLRNRTCRKQGHSYFGGANGEYRNATWKSWCATCGKTAPWAS